MPELPSDDCFQQLQKEAISGENVSVLIADARLFLRNNATWQSPKEQLLSQTWTSTIDTYAKQLLAVKKMPNISMSTKITAGRERARLEDLLRASKLMTQLNKHEPGDIKLDFLQSELDYLETRTGAKKVNAVFGKDYPVFPTNYLNSIKLVAKQHLEFVPPEAKELGYK